MAFPLKFDKLALQQYSAAFMFYIEKHKLLEIISRMLAEISVQPIDDLRQWMGENVRRIAVDLYAKCLDCFHRGVNGDFYQQPRSFFHRLVLHGRPGSGRHCMADALAKKWNLLIIDADVLAYHQINCQEQDEHTRELQAGIEDNCVYTRSEAIGNIIEQRLLKEDALHRGWILINYPNNRCEARYLFESFIVPPNRFIYLQIDEHLARARVVSKPYAANPQANITYLDRQMQQFRKSEPLLSAYLANRRETVHIDASPCFEEVKCNILSELTKTPYVLGHKYSDSTVHE